MAEPAGRAEVELGIEVEIEAVQVDAKLSMGETEAELGTESGTHNRAKSSLESDSGCLGLYPASAGLIV